MVLLAGTPQQGLIRRVLDESMLEQVGGLRQRAALIEHLGLHELHQAAPQHQLVPGGNGPQQLIGKLAPQCGPELRQALDRRQAIQPRHQRVV